MKFRDRLARFMYGRYGVDNLYHALIALYFIIFVLQVIFDKWWLAIPMWACLVIALLRLMSKNHVARAKENRIFLKLINPIKAFFSTNFVRIRDVRTKRYRTCKNCKAVLRLPIKKGTHNVKCPKCSKEFKVKILF